MLSVSKVDYSVLSMNIRKRKSASVLMLWDAKEAPSPRLALVRVGALSNCQLRSLVVGGCTMKSLLITGYWRRWLFS
jgi:hypothetical protein